MFSKFDYELSHFEMHALRKLKINIWERGGLYLLNF